MIRNATKTVRKLAESKIISLPPEFGIEIGTIFMLTQDGDKITMVPLPERAIVN